MEPLFGACCAHSFPIGYTAALTVALCHQIETLEQVVDHVHQANSGRYPTEVPDVQVHPDHRVLHECEDVFHPRPNL